MIAVDFFSQFDKNDLLGGEAAMRYRKAVLEPGGSKAGTELVRSFLGRPRNLDASELWMDEEFVALRGSRAKTSLRRGLGRRNRNVRLWLSAMRPVRTRSTRSRSHKHPE